MSTALILHLEDDPHDQQLVENTLKADGLACEIVHARTRDEFQTALKQSIFDLIISDYTLPSYDGMTAIADAKKFQPEASFIFVSGTIGEERAVASLKSGATDYILKGRLDRLSSAVRRALRENHDRAKRKQLEEQLRQAQKMEAIGQLAGGVAHDFNNLLVVIHGNVELVLMNSTGLSEQDRECLKQVSAAAERAANLARQLLAFGRKQVMQLQVFNLNGVIGNLTKMLDPIIGEHIRLQCNYATHLPFVQADVGMIEQVLVNLVVNAGDAMPHGGQLIISTEKICLSEADVRLPSETRAGEFVCLTVGDTGSGIAPENLPKIFEPFFTTKEPGKGTGLGLATAYGIVKQHHGWIEVSSQLGAGTRFKIFLPAAALPASEVASQAERPLPHGTERILLVEDNVSVRLLTKRVLEKFGYRVSEVATGREALDIWQARISEIDLLLTDMVMPDGVNGRELAEQLWKQRPGLKVIFTSGHSLETVGKDKDFLQKPNRRFLQKPCPTRTLVETVRRCLDGN